MADIIPFRFRYDLIDLGLSLKWSDRFFAADLPTNTGWYLPFGNMNPDCEFSKENYQEPSGKYARNGETTIVLTENDVIATKSRNELRLPTYREVTELTDSKDIVWFVAFRFVGESSKTIGGGFDKATERNLAIKNEIRVFLGEKPFACEINDKLCLEERFPLKEGYDILYHSSPSELIPYYLGACSWRSKELYRSKCDSETPVTMGSWFNRVLKFPFVGRKSYDEREDKNLLRGIGDVRDGKQIWSTSFPCGNIAQLYAFYNIAIFNYTLSYKNSCFRLDYHPHIAFSKTPWEGMNYRGVENSTLCPPKY